MAKTEQSPGREGLTSLGVESLSRLPYRTEVAKKLALATGTKMAFLFDDITRNDRGELACERAVLPGLLFAPGFENGAAVVLAAPMTPVETRVVKYFKRDLEQKIGRKVQYKVLFEHDGEIVDLLSLGDKEHQTLLRSFADFTERDNPHTQPDYAARIIKGYLVENPHAAGPALVIPHERRADHDPIFAEAVNSAEVVLPDTPDMDKIHNTFLLREHGSENLSKHLLDMIVVTSDGRTIENYEDLLYDERINQWREKTPETVTVFAQTVLDAIDTLHNEHGKQAYVVLDPERVSGAGNLDPQVYGKIYNHEVVRDERQTILERAINTMFEDVLPPRSFVSEFIDMEECEGEKSDYTVRGQMVNGEFLPTSVSKIGTTNAAYNRQWGALQPEHMGERREDWEQMLDITQQVAEVYSQSTGYKTGNFGLDIFKTKDGRYIVHDYNYRRGGASTPEAVLPLLSEERQSGLFFAKVVVPIEAMSPAQQVALYNQVAEELLSQNIFPFATGTGLDTRDDKTEARFNLLMLTDEIVSSDGAPLPQDEHFAFTKLHVEEALKKAGAYAN